MRMHNDVDAAPAAGVSTYLAIGDEAGLCDELRLCAPDAETVRADSFLSAIGEISACPVDVVFADIDPSVTELDKAISGLREAVGDGVSILLCCHADGEPLARRLLAAGADDYLIRPLRPDEVRDALAVSRATREPLGASVVELDALGDLVRCLAVPLEEFLGKLADLVRAAFGVRSAGVVVRGQAATSGSVPSTDPSGMASPVMTVPLEDAEGEIGHVALGAPLDAAVDLERHRSRLVQYAKLISSLVTAAGDHRRYHDFAYVDELSGLPNRRFLLEFLGRKIEEAKRDGSAVTLLMFDVDFFKRYNDAYGHDAGDEILRGCGELFRRNCRDHDVVTRYGGDEFAVVFWDKDGTRKVGSRHPSDVLPIIERFRESLRDYEFSGFRVHEESQLTISGGLASYPDDAGCVSDLITRADEALLKAKRDGKNRIFLGGENVGAAGVGEG